jgi:S-adenosylmethionine-diacylglycerol 3-amino-3-carboxypropyl transferase
MLSPIETPDQNNPATPAGQPANDVSLRDVKKHRNALLKSAVHNHSAISGRGILERMFSFMFRGFVYPQIWEDPEVDLEAMQLDQNCRIFTIASGGCNILNYLTESPAEIVAVDLNPAHVALARMKVSALKLLPNYDTYFKLFGEADSPKNAENYDTYLRDHLDPITRAYWDSYKLGLGRRINYFSHNIYRYGMLGWFIYVVHALAHLYGKDPRVLLNARTMEEQNALFNEHLAPLFEKRFIKFLCSMPVSLYGLGIPPAQFDALKGDAKEGDMSSLLKDRLRRLACDYDISENYFAWQAFSRGYDRRNRRAVPRYLKQDNFAKLRDQADKVFVHHLTLTDYLATQGPSSFDRYVFLDAQDWMNDDQLTNLWSEVTRTARPGARVIFRTAGADSILPGRIPDSILSRFDYDADQCKKWSAADRSSIYGGFHLYVFKG